MESGAHLVWADRAIVARTFVDARGSMGALNVIQLALTVWALPHTVREVCLQFKSDSNFTWSSFFYVAVLYILVYIVLGLGKYWYAHNALGFMLSCPEESWGIWIVSFPLDLSLWFRIFRCSHSHSLSLSKHISLSCMSLSPPAHMFPFLYSCFSCLCFLPLKCRNPSTAFYQAFRPARLRGSKPVNDRYELGCVYMNVCVAWPGWLNQTLHPFSPAHLARNCPFWLVVRFLWSFFLKRVKNVRRQFPEEFNLFWIFF